LAGFFLLYETIVSQRKSFEAQQFEMKFFELIKFHRENVQQLEYRVPWHDDLTYKGLRVFIELRSQMNKLMSLIKPIIEGSIEIPTDKKEYITMNFSYLILFYGISKENKPRLVKELFRVHSNQQVINEVIESVSSLKAKHNLNIYYFNGHRIRLSQYFRHLFQTVKILDTTSFLSEDKKYDYMKILRAQLSTYELAFFFYNSFTVGISWKDNDYINKYKIIKNLSEDMIEGIDPKKYYPKIKFDWDASM
jgi:hypothetical protein